MLETALLVNYSGATINVLQNGIILHVG